MRLGEFRFNCNGTLQGDTCFIGTSQLEQYRTVQANNINVLWMLDEQGSAFVFGLFELTGIDQAKNVVDHLLGGIGFLHVAWAALRATVPPGSPQRWRPRPSTDRSRP